MGIFEIIQEYCITGRPSDIDTDRKHIAEAISSGIDLEGAVTKHEILIALSQISNYFNIGGSYQKEQVTNKYLRNNPYLEDIKKTYLHDEARKSTTETVAGLKHNIRIAYPNAALREVRGNTVLIYYKDEQRLKEYLKTRLVATETICTTIFKFSETPVAD